MAFLKMHVQLSYGSCHILKAEGRKRKTKQNK